MKFVHNALYFLHINISDFLLVAEIGRVRSSLFQVDGVKKEPLVLPDPEGEPMTLTEKVFVPVKDHPDVSKNIVNIFIYRKLPSDGNAMPSDRTVALFRN